MKEWFKKHKNEIIVGVLVAIIVSVFNWFYDNILVFLPAAGYSIITAISNSVYHDASSIHMGTATFMLALTPIAIMVALIIFQIFLIVLARKLTRKTAKKNEAAEVDKNANSTPDKRNNEEPESQQNKPIFHLRLKKRYIFTLILSLITMVFMSIMTYLPVALWNRFEISITQIKPYTTESDIDILKSKWTLMKNKNDYDEINNYIMSIKQKNGILR